MQPASSASSESEWIDVPVIEDAVLVNVGDILDFWTNGRFKSSVHRVVVPRSEEKAAGRFSIVFFL